MVKEAEANAEADKTRRAQAEARNNAESLIHGTEKSIAEHKDKLEVADIEAAEAAIEDLKEALGTDDIEDINAKAEALSAAAMKLGETIYKQQQAESEGADGNDGPGSDDDDPNVVDADFEDVSEDDENPENQTS